MNNLLFTDLTDRSLISLSGPDTLTFLQGIVTNDVNRLSPEQALYSAILTPQGKFLDDFFLFQIEDRIYLDCSATRQDSLLKKLSLYRLRAAVEIEPADGLAIAALFSNGESDDPGEKREPGFACPIEEGLAFVDPRDKRLGARIVAPCGTFTNMAKKKSWQAVDSERYREVRLALAVAEGPDEIVPEKAYPMDFALDALNAISFTKGCYVGQEVTARMKARDLVKRRPVGFRLENASVTPGSAVSQDGKSIGEIRSVAGDHVLALISNEVAESDLDPQTENGETLTPIRSSQSGGA